jgi:hypothetical protein
MMRGKGEDLVGTTRASLVVQVTMTDTKGKRNILHKIHTHNHPRIVSRLTTHVATRDVTIDHRD